MVFSVKESNLSTLTLLLSFGQGRTEGRTGGRTGGRKERSKEGERKEVRMERSKEGRKGLRREGGKE